jgi:uncharacterized protein
MQFPTNTVPMKPDPSLSDEELEELESFLMSEDMSEDGMDISTLDGFLAAIVLNSQLIAPSRWLPWVWDMEDAEDSPTFADSQQANRILGLLMRHYNVVATSISGGWFDPLWMELAQEDGSEFFDAEGWCAGFMLGVKQFPDAWQAVFKGHMELLAPMVLLGTERGWKTLEERGQDAETRKRLIRGAYEAIPAAVGALQEYFKPEREQALRSSPRGLPEQQPRRRDTPKVGRNDPCPCGSGKKYKKCCGASESLQ